MIRTDDADEVAAWADRMRAATLSVGLVPTMGALHDGHFALIERARLECERVAVSVFVNPTQFGVGEDLDRYPRTPEDDAAGCGERGVDLLFFGQMSGAGSIYPAGFQTWVTVEELAKPLCGRHRPVHFRGVATVVAVLFGLFHPHRAYFGQKDFQQARLLERLARDLHTGVEVRIVPTVREADGLAMSSRNRYLSEAERRSAGAIPRALAAATTAFESGEERPTALLEIVRGVLAAEPALEVQYAEAVDASTLVAPRSNRVSDLPQGIVLAVAAYAGETRLIDNAWLRR